MTTPYFDPANTRIKGALQVVSKRNEAYVAADDPLQIILPAIGFGKVEAKSPIVITDLRPQLDCEVMIGIRAGNALSAASEQPECLNAIIALCPPAKLFGNFDIKLQVGSHGHSQKLEA